MAWADRLADAHVSTYYHLLVEGIPYAFSSLDPGALYTLTGYTCLPGSLDVSDGLAIPAQSVERKSGLASPTHMAFRVGPDTAAGTLRRLFAVVLAGGHKTVATDTVDWADASVAVVDTTGFSDANPLYCGRETMDPTGHTGTSWNVTRAQYGSLAWRRVWASNVPKGSVAFTDYPQTWEGRRVWLWQGFANLTGQPLDLVFPGVNERCVWAGRITSVQAERDWHHWSVSCESIDAQIRQRVCDIVPQGDLAPQTFTASEQQEGGSLYSASASGYVAAGHDTIRLHASWPLGGSDTLDIIITAGWYDSLLSAVTLAIEAQLNAAAAGWASYTWYCWWRLAKATDDAGDQGWRSTLHVAADGMAADDVLDLTLMVTEDSLARQLGWPDGGSFKGDSVANANGIADVDFDAPTLPPYYVLWGDQATILVRERYDQVPSQHPSTGYVVIRDGEQSEVISYTGTSVVKAGPPRTIQLTGCGRGKMGTAPLTVVVPSALGWSLGGLGKVTSTAADGAELPTESYAVAFDQVDLLDVFLRLCMSTGTAATRGSYDVAGIPEWCGLGLSVTDFDTATFTAATAALGSMRSKRNYAWTSGFRLDEWIGPELAAMGYALVSRMTASGYQITLDRIRQPPLIVRHALTTATIMPTRPDVQPQDLSQLINLIDLSCDWDVGKGELRKSVIRHYELDSQALYGTSGEMQVKITGITLDGWAMRVLAGIVSPAIISHFNHPYEIVQLSTTRAAWAYTPGQAVSVTLPSVPSRDGTSGWVAEPMVILAVEPVLVASGQEPATRLTLLHFYGRRLSYWAPSGYVSGWDGGTVKATISANVYSESTDINPITGAAANDVDWFTVGDTVRFQLPGGEAAGIERTVIGKVGQVLELSAGGVSTGMVVSYPTWASASAAQKAYVYIATVAGKISTTDTYQYAG